MMTGVTKAEGVRGEAMQTRDGASGLSSEEKTAPDAVDRVPQGQVARRPQPLNRVIRRKELRLLVPLSDTTIYEMEQRGEFPKRFYLTPRCAAWDLAEVQGWIELRRRASAVQAIKPTPHPDVGLRKTRPVRR
jgi:prophage regulatory protein